jgi:hypothetical protein
MKGLARSIKIDKRDSNNFMKREKESEMKSIEKWQRPLPKLRWKDKLRRFLEIRLKK